MARPRTGRNGRNITLYLDRLTLGSARRHAFECQTSLSDLVNRLLVAELSTKGGIAHKHQRSLNPLG